MCATACESRSTLPHAYSKPTQMEVPAGQGLWSGSRPLGPRIRRLMRMCDGTLTHVSSSRRRGM